MAIQKTTSLIFRYKNVLIILTILGFIGFVLQHELRQSYPDQRPNIVGGDLATYATLLIQKQSPNIYQSDLVYGNGKVMKSGNSPLYMQALELFHDLTNHQMERTMGLYRVLLVAIYVPGMMLFLNSLLHHRWISLGLALVSTIPSGFMATGTVWGMLDEIVLPLIMATAFLPWLAFLLYRYWYKPSVLHQPIRRWYILVLGVLCSLFTSQVHGITGLALIELAIGMGVAQSLRRKMVWKTIIFFLIGVVLGVLPQWATFQEAGVPENNDFFSMEIFLKPETNPSYMVFPWDGHLVNGLPTSQIQTLQDIKNASFALLAIHMILSLGLLFVVWRKGGRIETMVLVFVQAIYMLFLVNVGWLPLLLLLYGWYRIWYREVDELDIGLFITLVLTLIAGPLQQVILYYIWEFAELGFITNTVYEIARCDHLAYLPIYALLGRAILRLVPQEQPLLNGLKIVLASIFVAINLNQIPFVRADWSAANMGVAALTIVSGLLMLSQNSARLPKGLGQQRLVTVGNVALVCTLIAMPIQTHRQEKQRSTAHPLDAEYLAMTTWIQDNTPEESLFLLSQSDRGFRYYARRSIVAAWGEFSYSLYNGHDMITMLNLETSLYRMPFDPQRTIYIADQYHANYLIDYPQNPAFREMAGADDAIIYRDGYTIYDISRLPKDQFPHRLPPPLDNDFHRHHLQVPLDENAIIFNPNTGLLANRYQLIQTVIEWLNNHELPPDVQEHVFDLIDLLERSQYQSELNLGSRAQRAITQWRNTRRAHDLREAGINYLFVDSRWLEHLDPIERDRVINPQHYRLIDRWNSDDAISFYLYQVID